MSALDKTVCAHSDKNIAQHGCSFGNLLTFLSLPHLILKMWIIKWKSSKALLRMWNGTAAEKTLYYTWIRKWAWHTRILEMDSSACQGFPFCPGAEPELRACGQESAVIAAACSWPEHLFRQYTVVEGNYKHRKIVCNSVCCCAAFDTKTPETALSSTVDQDIFQILWDHCSVFQTKVKSSSWKAKTAPPPHPSCIFHSREGTH